MLHSKTLQKKRPIGLFFIVVLRSGLNTNGLHQDGKMEGFYQFMLAPKRAHLTHDTRILSVAFVRCLEYMKSQEENNHTKSNRLLSV